MNRLYIKLKEILLSLTLVGENKVQLYAWVHTFIYLFQGAKVKVAKLHKTFKKVKHFKFTVMLHRKATQSMIKVSWFIELEKKMIIKQKGIVFLSFFKVNILLAHHNCLLVQCIEGACWISLGVLSPVEGHSCCPTSYFHRSRGYLCSFPITWPPPPHLGKGIYPLFENWLRHWQLQKHPFFWLSHWIFSETKAKNNPVSRENGNAHAAPLCTQMCVCGGGGGIFHSLHHWVNWYCH